MTDGNDFVAHGNKVSLRLMTSDDTQAIVKWRNNKRVRDNFRYRETFTTQIHEKWVREQIEPGNVVQLIICDNEKNALPVGSVYFRDIDRDKRTAEYGIFIGEDDAIGKGFGNETALLATKYAKDVIGLNTLILRVFKFNAAAIKSYENAGFVKKADIPDAECSDGQKSDMILMEKRL